MEKTQITKGDMFYADLGTNIGSEQNGTRPVIIIQNDIGNKYAQTAIIVPLTKIIANKVKQPTHCIISPTDNLKHYSVALTEQIRVIDKSRLKTKIGRLNDTQIKDLDTIHLLDFFGVIVQVSLYCIFQKSFFHS